MLWETQKTSLSLTRKSQGARRQQVPGGQRRADVGEPAPWGTVEAGRCPDLVAGAVGLPYGNKGWEYLLGEI